MSSTSGSNGPPVDPGFWEFVSCDVCHLPFRTEDNAPPPIPFWVTECAHVVCNGHLNADQSCAVCGGQNIALVALQTDLEPPLSNWFGSTPFGLDTVVQTARFQYQHLTSLVRYYKDLCSRQRTLLERVAKDRSELKNLRLTVEQLRSDNGQLQQQLQYAGSYEPADILNSNGKRRMISNNRHSTSSPRSIVTPIGPNRITLPPEHHEPTFGVPGHPHRPSTMSNMDNGMGMNMNPNPNSDDRPGSSRFASQFAYVPSSSQQQQQMHPQTLSHAQRTHLRPQAQLQTHPQAPVSTPAPAPGPSRAPSHLQGRFPTPSKVMPPPPTPNPTVGQHSFPAAQQQQQQHRNATPFGATSNQQYQRTSDAPLRNNQQMHQQPPRSMLPPPTPNGRFRPAGHSSHPQIQAQDEAQSFSQTTPRHQGPQSHLQDQRQQQQQQVQRQQQTQTLAQPSRRFVPPSSMASSGSTSMSGSNAAAMLRALASQSNNSINDSSTANRGRFVPQTPSNNPGLPSNGAGTVMSSRAPSRASGGGNGGGGGSRLYHAGVAQRKPFMPAGKK